MFSILVSLFLLFSCARAEKPSGNMAAIQADAVGNGTEWQEPAMDSFFTTVESLRIRSEPSVNSMQVGSLKLFDMADIIARTENSSIVDGIDDFWYKITFNDIEGYVFGAYGVIIKAKYEAKTIDDFMQIFSSVFQIEEGRRYIFTGYQNTGVPVVMLANNIALMDHDIYLTIFFRLIPGIDVDSVAEQYDFEISDGSNNFGQGDAYKLLTDDAYSDKFITKYGNSGRYSFLFWGSGFSYDIANFLFESEFDNIFDGIIVSPLNLWLDNRDTENIIKITNGFIEEAGTNKVRESVLFHIFFQIMLRVKIE